MGNEYPAIGVLGVALAALAIWLIVRFINRPRKRGRLFLGCVAATALVSYPLSIGPFMSFYHGGYIPNAVAAPIFKFYAPVIWLFDHSPTWSNAAFQWYLNAWIGMSR